MDVAELLRQSEGKKLEFKRNLGAAEPILRTVVAFANTAGGTILLGVEDRTRRVVGVDDPLDLEQRIANLISDCVRPRLIPEIAVLPWRNTHLVAVQIHASAARPHFLQALGAEDGTFVRVGSTDRKADRVLLGELRRSARDQAFDEHPVLELDSEAIDFRAASELFAPTRRLTRRDLTVLGLEVEDRGIPRPTAGGILLFGRDRRRWFPDAYVQVGRFGGIDRARIVDTAEIHSHLPIAVEEALAFVRKHESVTLEIRDAREAARWRRNT